MSAKQISNDRPGWPYRLFLRGLQRAAGDRDGVPLPERLPPQALKELRRITGTPSFPQVLSSLQIRRWTEIEVPCGDAVRPARLYRPRGKVRGIVLFLHGGGFVHCDLVSHHGICCRLARHSGAMVLSLDYRLAPEHPFPAAVDDAWGALGWLAEQGRQFGLSLAVAGDSAGGNLAAVLAMRAREAGAPRLAAQLLFYPVLSGSYEHATRAQYSEGYMLTDRLLRWYGAQYLDNESQALDPDFAPLLVETFEGLAPAFVITAGFDPLRGEGELYAAVLRRAGVRADYLCFRRAIHGFLNGYALIVEGRRALRLGGAFLRARFCEARRQK